MSPHITHALKELEILRNSEFQFFVDKNLYGGAIRAVVDCNRKICPLVALVYIKKQKWIYWRTIPTSELAHELGFTIEATDAILIASDQICSPTRKNLEMALGI